MFKRSRVRSYNNKDSRNSIIERGEANTSRGKAKQLFDRYISLADEAIREGDPIMAESYYQHAEHYLRIMNDIPPQAEISSTYGKLDHSQLEAELIL